jgi:hypothetical protein
VEQASNPSLVIVKGDSKAGAERMGGNVGGWFGADFEISYTHNDCAHLVGCGIVRGWHQVGLTTNRSLSGGKRFFERKDYEKDGEYFLHGAAHRIKRENPALRVAVFSPSGAWRIRRGDLRGTLRAKRG